MRESVQKLVRPIPRRAVGLQPHVLTFLIAPTMKSDEIWRLWQEWEMGTIGGSPNALARVGAVARVDATVLNVCARSISVSL